jgi:hypothetical protein
MSITIDVDPVTYLVSRVLTAGVFVGIGAAIAWMAGEKLKLPNQPLRVVAALVGLGSGLGSFLAEWASIKLSLCVGLTVMIVGATMAFEKQPPKTLARLAGAITLLAVGTAWVSWNVYVVFR